ncbi:MAG: hypothetical protein QM820_58620 [Minicystis sp.]
MQRIPRTIAVVIGAESEHFDVDSWKTILEGSTLPDKSSGSNAAVVEDILYFEFASLWASLMAPIWFPDEGGRHGSFVASLRGRTGSKKELRKIAEPASSFAQEPLWAALDRHLEGRSTDADRTLLTSLASNPTQCPEPLAMALKYYVRGDVAFPDGSEVTLDELCDEAGVAHFDILDGA